MISGGVSGHGRVVLTEAYTDKYDGGYNAWLLNSVAPMFGGHITMLDFDESTRYLTICLDNGMEIKKYNPSTLIYKPYGQTKNVYNNKG